MKKTSVFALVILFSLLLVSCSKPTATSTTEEHFLLKSREGTASILVFEDQEKYTNQFNARLDELKGKWDPKNKDSDIAKFNNTRSNSHLSDETIKLLLNSITLSDRTDGKLDITLYPLTRLWGFESDEPKVPQSALVSLLVTKCGMDTISVSNNMFTLDQYTMLDPSAITSGFAADLISNELVNDGCASAMFQIEDHIRTIGKHPDQKKWEVPLVDPFEKAESFGNVLVDGEVSVSVKGAFQNYFVEDGKRYCNIFDPESGQPVDNDLIAAFVICKDGVSADAYATACFILGSKKAEKFYRDSNDFELILVLNDGEVRISQGIQESVQLLASDKKIKVIKK